MIMGKRSLVFVLMVATVSAFFLLFAREQGVCQEITHEAGYYNEQGLSCFNQGYYTLLPRGRTEEANQLLDQAIEAFRRAIAINDAFADAHLNLARVYSVQKRFPEAAEEYKRLIELRPDDIDVYVKLASTYANMDKYPEAVDVLEKAKKIESDERVVARLNEFIQKLQRND
jgi:tetratricopeptide (TPR) repeat protein